MTHHSERSVIRRAPKANSFDDESHFGIGFRPIKLLEHPENLYNYPIAPKSPQQKIIGIRTDFRRAGESEGAVVNAMIECSCDWLVRSREELMGTISQFF